MAIETIWIIGASTGIGRELAIQYQQMGAKVLVSARNEQALSALSDNHPQTESFPMDIASLEDIQNTIKEFELRKITPTKVIIMAAAYQPGNIEDLDIVDVKKTVQTNLTGPIWLVHAILPLLKKQMQGQIAICASVAGYLGLPSGQPYSCTKAALINFTECLKAELYHSSIDIKLINPGFIKTRLTDKNTFPMPFIMTADKAAKIIIKGLNSKAFEINFPKRLTWALKLLNILPYWLLLPIIGRIKT